MTELTGQDLKLKRIRGRLLETKEVAAFLRVSTRWVQDHMQKGTFPIRWYPIGPHKLVVDSADIDEWLQRIRIEAGTVMQPTALPVTAIKKIIKKEEPPM